MNPTYDFAGKIALVTNACEPIGFAVAEGFARNGASVVLSGKNKEPLISATERLAAAGHVAIAVACDASIETEVEALISRAVGEFGHLNMAFNNASTVDLSGLATEDAVRTFDAVNDGNLREIWACTKHQLNQMDRQGHGSIVNCASLGALLNPGDRGGYRSTKDAVISLTRCAALDFAAKNIRVNAVCPDAIGLAGTTDVEDPFAAIIRANPVGRLGRPDEVAAAVLWLCSDAASFAIGVALPVDGGATVYCT